MVRMLICIMLCCILIACNTPEEKKKLDLEAVKENRDGLDFHSVKENLFIKLDELLKQWHLAQKKQDFSGIQYLGTELEQTVRGNFSEVVKGLDNENSYIAAASLGFGDYRAIPYLNIALMKGDDETRNNAALALGHLGSSDTPMEPLLKVLSSDTNESVRAMAAFAISQIVQKDKDEGTLQYLLSSLKDPAFMVRSHVVLALEKIGNHEGLRAISVTTVSDEHPAVRYNSLRALGSTKDKAFAPVLVTKLEDPVEQIRAVVYDILKEWSGEDFGQNNLAGWKKWAGIE